MRDIVSEDFHKMLRGYGLTTARIWYTHPDAPDVINPNWLMWQTYDICPDFPELRKYLRWWQEELDGKPAIVQVAHWGLIRPAEFEFIGTELRLH